MSNEKGQTLIELVVVIAVSVIVVGALVFAIIASLRNASFSKNQAQATKLAQEGIERTRLGRDRNRPVTNLLPVVSWNGTGANDSIWDHVFAGDCEQEQSGVSNRCYFNVDATGSLAFITSYGSTKLPPGAELLGMFTRAVILSNDLNSDNKYDNNDPLPPLAKSIRVTSLVQWTDFSGEHQSKLTTILRKIQ